MQEYSKKERTTDIACLILFPLGFIILAILAIMGFSEGFFAETYISSTQIVSAILVMILPVLRLTKKFRSPYWFMFLVTSVPYLHAVSLFLGFYHSFANWDFISHTYSSIIVGLIVFISLLIIQHYTVRIDLGSTATILFFTFIIAWGFGNIWEITEWIIDNAFGNALMSYSVMDTLGDLVISDLTGAILTDVLAGIILSRYSITQIVEEMNLDRFMDRIGKKWDKKCGNESDD
ncbi:MAG: hypothetical protein RBR05_03210 [Candidatus Methanomethylophilaceae archaeon]|nr:hypothetical protein [Candidatus Methanomethylophilaceae archaeon]MDD3378770.1 hypothetical protein [Candidatus Methanomethylophilaceae archaeon]MDY0224392.1 hypothetical protein [Candidatus Methanomethylophilaceae archaeon]